MRSTGTDPGLRSLRYWWAVAMLILATGLHSPAHAAFFDIDEVLEALKQEIQTVQATESGPPRFAIDRVELTLAVFSQTADGDRVTLYIVGGDESTDREQNPVRSFHTMYLSLVPGAAGTFASDLSYGLVEAITKAKASLKKAYLNPPSVTLESFHFTIVFAVMRKKNGGIRFVTTDLVPLQARRIPTHTMKLQMSIATE